MSRYELVLGSVADREEVLLDELVELTIERDAYRLLAQQAIHHSHARYIELRRLRAGYQRLLGALRLSRDRTTVALGMWRA